MFLKPKVNHPLQPVESPLADAAPLYVATRHGVQWRQRRMRVYQLVEVRPELGLEFRQLNSRLKDQLRRKDFGLRCLMEFVSVNQANLWLNILEFESPIQALRAFEHPDIKEIWSIGVSKIVKSIKFCEATVNSERPSSDKLSKYSQDILEFSFAQCYPTGVHQYFRKRKEMYDHLQSSYSSIRNHVQGQSLASPTVVVGLSFWNNLHDCLQTQEELVNNELFQASVQCIDLSKDYFMDLFFRII